MLANVLPGLRDIRAPLAAGYVWLLSIYVAFEPLAPRKPRGIWATLTHAQHVLSPIGIGVALSFLAYLLGAISQSAFGFLTRIEASSAPDAWSIVNAAWADAERGIGISRFLPLPDATEVESQRSPRRWWRREDGHWLHAAYERAYGPVGNAALREITRSRLASLHSTFERTWRSVNDSQRPIPSELDYRGTDPFGAFLTNAYHTRSRRERLPNALVEAMEPTADIFRPIGNTLLSQVGKRLSGLKLDAASTLAVDYSIRANVTTELRLGRISLIGKEPDLFSEIDRLQSEGEFRCAVAPPLVGLAAAFAWRAPLWSALLPLAAAIVLVVTGRAQARRANDALIEAIRVRRASVPTLDRIDEAVEALKNLAIAQQSDDREEVAEKSPDEPTSRASGS